MSSRLQELISWVTSLCVFLDGLQQERVAGDSLHRHHQEETQRGGVDFRPKEINGNTTVACLFGQFLFQASTGNDINLR